MNTYFQCPRKYFYIYKLKMRTAPSIHLVRGSAAHYALEKLYSLVPEVLSDNYRQDLKTIAVELLKKAWKDSKEEFDKLDMSEQQIEQYLEETKTMMLNQVNFVSEKIDSYIQSKDSNFVDAFRALSPKVEEEYLSWDYYVKGFIDVIEDFDGVVRLMDYKTSKRAKMSDQYKLQLAIYALLYSEKHGKLPDEVGIYFVKFPQPEMTLKVDDELLQLAKFKIEQIHASTTGDDIVDFPKNQTPLCKWSSGQCDFYDYCFKSKEIPKEPLKREWKGN
ncbi:MAG: PD-(D/E)XK nuclease family protein, partial [Patescibacteria group bacterium]|nr:PD-(D/E)XK nuclease family protein [Patescibacteria group bacterium]